MSTWTKPIYKIEATIEIPQIIRGKEKGVTTITTTFISKYKSLRELMLKDTFYFFGRLKLKYDAEKQYEKKIRIKGEKIIATTNDYYQDP